MERRPFGISTLQLAYMRIGVALLMILTLVRRLPYISEFYTEKGYIDTASARSISDNPHALSLSYLIPADWFQFLLFALAGAAALSLAIGYKTKFSSIACFALLTSIDVRNQFLLYAANEALRATLFWMMLLPLDQALVLKKKDEPDRLVDSPFAFGLILQITLIYFFGFILKDSVAWKQSGDALELALSNPLMSEKTGVWLSQFGSLLKPFSLAIYYFEGLAPILVLLAWSELRLRKFLVGGLVAFHLGIWFFMKVSYLPLVNFVGLICLWPASATARPMSETKASSVLQRGLGYAFISYLVFINIFTLPSKVRIHSGPLFPAKLILMDQSWMFFAPQPYKFDGYWELIGESKSGAPRALSFFNDSTHAASEFNAKSYSAELPVEQKTFFLQLIKPEYARLREDSLRRLCAKHSNLGFESVTMNFHYRELTPRVTRVISSDHQTITTKVNCTENSESKEAQ